MLRVLKLKKEARERDEKAKDNKVDLLIDRIDLEIKNNKDIVVSSFRSTVKINSLNVVNYSKFKKDLFEFCDALVSHEDRLLLAAKGTTFKMMYNEWLADELIRVIEFNYADELRVDARSLGTWEEYEKYCAQKFLDAGWNATMTPRGGDQGVDVVAEKKAIRVAVQCKKQVKPVGNRAVQEIVAGRNYYAATFAVVVAPNGFTTAAVQLANSNSVQLLHHQELEGFIERLTRDIS